MDRLPGKRGHARFRWFALLASALLVTPVGDAADCNGNGAEDAEDIASGASDDCNGDGLPDECQVVPPAFAVPVAEKLGGTALAVELADFDGDGRLEVFAASTARGLFLEFFRAAGTAGLHATVQRFRLPFRSVRVADVTGDGTQDILLQTGDSLVILRVTLLGERFFGLVPEGTLPTGRRLSMVTTADVDGDGVEDVLASRPRDRTLVLWRSQRGGRFADPATFPVDNAISDLVTFDLEGDGDRDVVALHRPTAELSVLLNDGGGRFPEVRRVSLGRSRLTALATGDLDGDGMEDMVVGAPGGFVIVENRAGELRSGSFHRVEEVGEREAPPLDITDIDLDGDLDVVATARAAGKVVFHLNAGGGTFASVPAIDLGRTGLAVSHQVVGDLTGDGRPDVAGDDDMDLVARNPRGLYPVVLWNDGDGMFGRSTFLAIGRYSMRSMDLDADGADDLLVSRSPPFVVYGGPGAELGGLRAVQALTNLGGPVSLAALDGDTAPDLLFVGGNATAVVQRLFNRSGSSTPSHLPRICTEEEFHRVASPSFASRSAERLTKFILPARADDPDLLPLLFQNVNRFPLHRDFLEEVFPERFGALDLERYDRLVNRRATREYWVGTVSRLRGSAGPIYGFDVLTAFLDDPTELPAPVEARGIYEALAEAFRLRPLAYAPGSRAARESARGWQDPGFPLHLEDPLQDIAYKAYTLGVAYGRVRLFGRDELSGPSRSGRSSGSRRSARRWGFW